MRHLFNKSGPDPSESMYRHEYKYEIDSAQLALLEGRVSELMMPDPHAEEQGRYQIRSLYFDDWYDSCYYDKEEGVDPREKFRIRIYNGSSDLIRLELKRKEAGKIHKKTCPMTLEQTETLIHGGRLYWDPEAHPLLKRLYLLQETAGMRPKVIVEYDRVPYVHRDGNVRVTMDLDVRTSADVASFLDKETHCRPIMPTGRQLMEVKWDEFIPDHIYRALQIEGLRQTTFSKYSLCRRFGGRA